MLIDGDCEFLFCLVLTDDVVFEEFFYLDRLWKRGAACGRFLLLIIGDDLVADVDALVADVNRRAGNKLLDFVLRLAAKRAAQCIVASSHQLSDLAKFLRVCGGSLPMY